MGKLIQDGKHKQEEMSKSSHSQTHRLQVITVINW